ncbi:MAG: hypothetical protein EPO39_12480 [Candidatus Manganitrophaceae bacterium]|nr:MAG: hypothetical protein EPO39_12480 [Candidatus Manganitrophaceae bacterium]
MHKRATAVVLLVILFFSIGAAGAADEKDVVSRNRILREHHKLLHQMLMVMKDQAEITEKILSGKASVSERKSMKKRMADMTAEIDGMVQKHDGLMKSFEEMIQKRDAPEKPPEETP